MKVNQKIGDVFKRAGTKELWVYHGTPKRPDFHHFVHIDGFFGPDDEDKVHHEILTDGQFELMKKRFPDISIIK